MPAYSGKRTYDNMNAKKWGGRNNPRRDDRRPSALQNRIAGGSRPMVNPWENGVTPGMQSNMLNQSSFSQPLSTSYLLNSGMNRGNFGTSNFGGGGFGGGSNKMRRLDNRMGGFDDQRGRGLLPSPSNAPLLGVAPPAFPPPGRGPEFLQQRMGNPWESSSSFRSGGPRGMNSGYYPSNRGRQDNSRKFVKAKRPLNKSSSTSSSSTSKGGGSKEARGRPKGGSSTKSPKREDKEKDSKTSKQGGEHSPPKRERSSEGKSKDDVQEEEDEEEMEEGKEVVKEELEESKNEEEEKKEVEEKNEEEAKKDKEKPQEEPFPVKALYCHICELDSFSSKKGYIRHLQGITHAKMAEMFHAKNAATLELLNISAKLAEMRQRDKVLRRTGKKGQPVMKTTEQILVQKWLKVGSCCGTKYKSPFGLEEHKLSIHHLKAKYMLKQKDSDEKHDDEVDEEGNPVIKEETKIKEETEDKFVEESHDEVVRLSSLLDKAETEALENPLEMNTLPVYNPSEMMGMEFIRKELRFRCKVCQGQMFKSLENHCQSHAHFDNIASHLNKVEDAKREEKRKKEEAEAEEKKEKERLEKEKAEELKAAAAAAEAEAKEKEGIKKDAEEEEEDDGGSGIPSDFITVDACAKDKSDDEDHELDEDVIPIGEEEERILNATEEEEEEEKKEEEDDEVLMESEIFEEVGEKIDFDEDLKKQLENGKKEEEVEEPPQKKPAYTPRRRGRARGRGRMSK